MACAMESKVDAVRASEGVNWNNNKGQVSIKCLRLNLFANLFIFCILWFLKG